MRYVVTALVTLLLPIATYAQSADMRASIRAELLKDPQTAQLSEADLNALVDALAQKAQSDGVTSADLSWQPQSTERVTPIAAGELCSGLSCFSARLGVSPLMTQIAIGILVAGGILWFTTYEFRHRRSGGSGVA
jgi:hypothetical protein